MQNLDPKDRPKLIGISVALVAVVGFGIKYTIDTVNGIAPPASAATPSPAPPVAGVAGTAPNASGKPGTPNPTEDTNTYSLDRFPFVAHVGRDPFAPVPDAQLVDASIKVPGLGPAPTPAPSSTGSTTTGPLSIDKRLSGMAGYNKSLDDFNKDREGVGKPVVPPPPIVRVLPPAPPAYNVIGVIISEPSGRDVAILQHTTGTDKKFVVVGDPLDGGYTVTGIESGGVRVKHPGHSPVTSAIPGIAQTQVPGTTEYFLPRQTIVVPATSMTLPLGETTTPSTPGAPGVPGIQSPAPRAK